MRYSFDIMLYSFDSTFFFFFLYFLLSLFFSHCAFWLLYITHFTASTKSKTCIITLDQTPASIYTSLLNSKSVNSSSANAGSIATSQPTSNNTFINKLAIVDGVSDPFGWNLLSSPKEQVFHHSNKKSSQGSSFPSLAVCRVDLTSLSTGMKSLIDGMLEGKIKLND